MEIVTETKQCMNNENPAYITKSIGQSIQEMSYKSKRQTNLPQKGDLLKKQRIKILLLKKFEYDLIMSTESDRLLDTNIIHNIINEKEHATMFVVAGATHCRNIADPLTKLGYKKTKITERTFDNNPLSKLKPGIGRQHIPVHINKHFSRTCKRGPKNPVIAVTLALAMTAFKLLGR